MVRRLLLLPLLIVLSVTGGGTAAYATQHPAARDSTQGEAVRYLVKYADKSDPAGAARALKARNIPVARTFSAAFRGAAVTATKKQIAELVASGEVAEAELDAPVTALETQQPLPWGLDRVDQRTLPLSGSYTPAASGAGVRAYVLDTGVLPDHADLAGRVSAGWSVVGADSGTNDCNGHGTHVAGIIGGSTYGVAKEATIVPVRVLDCNGSAFTSDVIAGLDWIITDHAAGTPAVANMSLGGDAPSSLLDAAVQRLLADGVGTVIAAGNSAVDSCNTSPARVPEAITVAASGPLDQQATFSNFGPCVDLYAPGVAITAAGYTSSTATAVRSGTSTAAPHVAGAAAVLLSQHPGMTPSSLAARIQSDATTGVVTGAGQGTPNRMLFLDPSAGTSEAVRAISAAAAAAPGIGTSTGPVTCGLLGGGCYQKFQGGDIHWSPATGAKITKGAIGAAWAGSNWENGFLGYPIGNEVGGLKNGGAYQKFQGGDIHWSPATGAKITKGAIGAAWAGSNWENGFLGYPIGNEVGGLKNGGAYQKFQGGDIHWSPATGAKITRGAIGSAWANLKWENGFLGYPTGNEVGGLKNGGAYQDFQGGVIYWSAGSGAYSNTGAIRQAYASQGWENGRLGYPTSHEYGLGAGVAQDYQGGRITWSAGGGTGITYK